MSKQGKDIFLWVAIIFAVYFVAVGLLGPGNHVCLGTGC